MSSAAAFSSTLAVHGAPCGAEAQCEGAGLGEVLCEGVGAAAVGWVGEAQCEGAAEVGWLGEAQCEGVGLGEGEDSQRLPTAGAAVAGGGKNFLRRVAGAGEGAAPSLAGASSLVKRQGGRAAQPVHAGAVGRGPSVGAAAAVARRQEAGTQTAAAGAAVKSEAMTTTKQPLAAAPASITGAGMGHPLVSTSTPDARSASTSCTSLSCDAGREALNARLVGGSDGKASIVSVSGKAAAPGRKTPALGAATVAALCHTHFLPRS